MVECAARSGSGVFDSSLARMTTETDYYNSDPLFRSKLHLGLDRFVQAQDVIVSAANETSFEVACKEILAGRKATHWSWWVFPQRSGLGYSFNSRLYAIEDATEAIFYMKHPVLRERYLTAQGCMWYAMGRMKLTAEDILGEVDALKFKSSTELLVPYA